MADNKPKIDVKLARDGLSAELAIILPPPPAAPVPAPDGPATDEPAADEPVLTVDLVKDKLKSMNIKFGLNDEAVALAILNPGGRFEVARGVPPVNGTDARIKYYFNLDERNRPRQNPDGSVDFKHITPFIIKHEGDVLAEKIPATAGIPGTNIFGNPIPARNGRDVRLPQGKGTHIVDLTLVADFTGQVEIINGKVTMLPVLEINGDVDTATGNIDYDGTVIVHGSIQTGYIVNATANIDVEGSMTGSAIAGQDLRVNLGINGTVSGRIEARQDIITRFIDNAVVRAGGNIVVYDFILHSHCTAQGSITCRDGRGQIAGGKTVAGSEIVANVLGAPAASHTEIQVGIDPDLREEYHRLQKELASLNKDLDNAHKVLDLFRLRDPQTLPPDKQQLVLRMTKLQFQMSAQKKQMEERLAELEKMFASVQHGKIKALHTCHSGVKLIIGNCSRQVTAPIAASAFVVEQGEIRVAPL
ncbi:MAG: FapA family protein [Negativicutes bacterium]|nr:FapA family protein [Negativicutes bacterium]